MPMSMYQATMPVLSRSLKNLKNVLEKAAAHAEANGIKSEVLVNARLFPDMLPLARQVHIATDNAKGCAARLSGGVAPSWPDTEFTFPELIERVQRCVDYLAEFRPEVIDGSEGRDIVLKFPNGEYRFQGMEYVQNYLLPNFFFHVTMTYAILRHNGVRLGKSDYLGS